MKTYAGWQGTTPGFAIAKMIAFHEGKQAAKGAWERVAEIDNIVQAAIEQALTERNTKGGFTPRTKRAGFLNLRVITEKTSIFMAICLSMIICLPIICLVVSFRPAQQTIPEIATPRWQFSHDVQAEKVTANGREFLLFYQGNKLISVQPEINIIGVAPEPTTKSIESFR